MREGILAHVGNTPMVLLKNSSPNPNVKIWAKLEMLNPSGSLKDRVALSIVEGAEKRGELRPGMTLVEATSGNTGIALGMVAAVKGYKLKIFMSEAKTIERRKILKYWGADLVLTTKDDPDSHILSAMAYAKENPDCFYANQNENFDNVEAHRTGTGVEIIEQLNGQVDAFVAGFGTGGCLMGVAKAFHDKGVPAKVYGVEPMPNTGGIDGLKHRSESYQPLIADRGLLAGIIDVSRDEAIAGAKAISAKEGIMAGMSSGATLHGAQQLALKMDRGNIVVIFGDRGERYFSTPIFDYQG
ncbi:cysteine synthase [Thermanaerovibrio velox DSM 12556]|uniref:Cysteine synthase n=1 Tax=Thermanaerovibrio velox DSM 12556 TaxID=926567 RepID=H0UN74_9BACT|nr:cysteine synthase family protein [Thermanaerovibrio velox]EHM10359.1 cysteine synthase [Thermanaerovibrio velox DSM 12556]